MHHLFELISNPFILISIIVIFAGEYINPVKVFLEYLSKKFAILGEWILTTYEYKLYANKESWIKEKNVDLRIDNFFAKTFFFILATTVVIFIEVFWELGFKKVTRSLEKSRFAVWSENFIKNLNPYIVLALFGLPFIFMETIGIFAFLALASGHIYTGIALYIFKVFFFIPVHFILHTGEEQLMSIQWFKRRYDLIILLLTWFKKSQTYVRVHNVSEIGKGYLKALKNAFFNRVSLIKKAFENGEVLSPECQQKFNVIKDKQDKNEKIKKEVYVDFFECIHSHIEKEKESLN